MERESLLRGQSVSSTWSHLNQKWKILIISLALFSFVILLTFIITLSVISQNRSSSNEPNGLCSRGDELKQLTSSASGLYRANRKQLASYFSSNGLLYLVGDQKTLRNSYSEYLFRQSSNFLYVSGINNPNCSILISTNSSFTYLFIPDPSAYDALYYRKEESLDELRVKFDVDQVLYNSQFSNFTSQFANSIFYISKSLINIPDAIKNYTLNNTYLDVALMDSRTIKTPQEIFLLRIVSEITSSAHKRLMEECTPGLYEYQAESLFLFETYNCFLRQQSYVPIVASGYNSAILHYTTNDRKMLDGDLLLIDAAGEYVGYGSDVTRTFPVNGVFTDEQRIVYQAVLNVQTSIINMLAPGVNWSDVSYQTRLLTAQELIKANLVVGSIEDILSNNVDLVFLPHPVGHFVGLDVHDTYRGPTILQAGQIVTIEPGIYFNEALLSLAFKDPNQLKFLNVPLIEKYQNFGGVRIEDVILITPNGHEVFSNAPKEIADIEKTMTHSK